MKKLITLTVLLAIAATSAFYLSSSHAMKPARYFELGQTLDKNLKFKTLDGEQIQLKDIESPIVMIHFWASWCGPCIVEFPHMLEALRGMDNDIAVIAISLDHDPQAMNRYIAEQNTQDVPVHWVHDANYEIAMRKFLIRGTPETVFIDRNQKVVKHMNDGYDWESGAAWKELTSLVAGSI